LAKYQHSQIENRTLRSEESRFEISILPAEKPFHNFEQIINKQNYYAEWKLRSTNSAKYLYSAFHTYGGGARDSAPCPCVMLKARDHQRRCSDSSPALNSAILHREYNERGRGAGRARRALALG
jgi:hypothetical protein